MSHDLRTPLATIAGASSSLLTAKGLDAETRAELLHTIYDEAERLSRLVENLLSMTRLESGVSRSTNSGNTSKKSLAQRSASCPGT